MKRLHLLFAFLCLTGISLWRLWNFYEHYRTDPKDMNMIGMVVCGSIAIFWIVTGILVIRPDKKK